MEVVWNVLKDTVLYVLNTLLHNLPALAAGILAASAMQVYVNTEKMKNWLMRRSSVSIPATVAFGAFTPFCACGTMAVVLAMMATALPWGPIMAFLTSSPLMSPEEFIMISGVISPGFAIALTVSSVIIGIGSGYIAHFIQKRTHFLDNQLRFAGKKAEPLPSACTCDAGTSKSAASEPVSTGCACSSTPPAAASVSCCTVQEETCGCGGEAVIAPAACCGAAAVRPAKTGRFKAFIKKCKIDKLLKAAFDIGIKKILPLFALFAGIGYLINRFIPAEWITAVFGAQNGFAVPLSAVIGLPLYVNGDSSIPLIQSLMQSGVSPGAMLAFMITGPGTSAGVLAGIATIMKKKAIALYVACLLVFAILLGYAFDLIMALV